MKYKFLTVILLFFTIVTSLTACSLLIGGESDNNPESIFEEVWNDFNNTYALFSVKNIKWDEIYTTYRPRINNNMNNYELYEVIKDMLLTLHDGHVYLMTPFGYMNSKGVNDTVELFSIDMVVNEYLDNNKHSGDGLFTYGRIKNHLNIGYIHIKSFHSGLTMLNQRQDWANDIDIIINELNDTDSIIVDVRGNRGGLTGNANLVAGRFVLMDSVYAFSKTKNGPEHEDFGPSVSLEVKKAGSKQYNKRIILISNKETMSAGEQFVLAMKTQPHVIHTGSGTHGVFSLSLQRTLVNGWKYSVSVQRVTDPTGNCYEDIGILPIGENFVTNSQIDMDIDKDTQLEKAIELTFSTF